MTATEQKWFTLQEAADILRVSTSTIRNWKRSGNIAAAQLPGGSIRIAETELNRLLAVPA